MIETAPKQAIITQPEEPPRGIRPRAILLGLLMSGVIIGMTQVLSINYRAAEVAGDAPPPAPTYFLFLYTLFAAPLLMRLSGRLALSRAELLVIYAMMIVTGPITHQFGIGFMVPHAVSPLYYDAEEPHWSKFKPFLPSWLAPTDRAAVLGFFRGTHGVVPWASWLIPMLAWSSLLIALFFVMLCVNVIMRRQWIDNERLSFPLAAIPIVLAEDAGADEGSILSRSASIFRHPLFWIGIAITIGVQLPNELHRYVPSTPAIPMKEVVILDAGKQLSPPWNGLGEIYFSLAFWLVGVVYLLPTELAFSAWFFYLVCLFENVAAVAYGKTGETPSVYSNDFPALYAQGAGAALMLTAITLYTARGHLRAVLRKAFRHDRSIDDRGEFLSYRTASWGLLVGVSFILWWLWLAGMRLWVAGLLFALMLAYFFIFTRIRAETGLGMGVILWPKMLDEVMITLVGAKYLTLADSTILYSLRWLYFGPAIGSVMAAQLEGFKLTNAGGLRGRSVGWTFALVATLTVVVAFAWTLQTYYNRGFDQMPIGQRETSMVGTQVFWSYGDLMDELNAPQGPQWGGILAMFSGGLVAFVLSWMRLRFLWFPLHPVGFIAANSWGMHLNWFSFLLGWLIKVAITRYGGMKVYQRMLPLFWGLIVGDMLHTGLWGFVTWAVGGRQG